MTSQRHLEALNNPSEALRLPARHIEGGEVSWERPDDLENELQKRAHLVWRRYRDVVPYDDLLQEARIYAATHPGTLRDHLADPAKGVGYFGWFVQRALEKVVQRIARDPHHDVVSLDELLDQVRLREE